MMFLSVNPAKERNDNVDIDDLIIFSTNCFVDSSD